MVATGLPQLKWVVFLCVLLLNSTVVASPSRLRLCRKLGVSRHSTLTVKYPIG